MESWRIIWRRGISPLLTWEHLTVLRQALLIDDPRLLQGATTIPPPMTIVASNPCEAADPIGFCHWIADGQENVADVEEFFARVCFECDQRIQEPAACRWFINFWDESPREEARALLLGEVARALDERAKTA